ncbi:beta strand repeat-containing protein [Halospeciosus flavus]|uniref:Beta strand repeat-containing protein n=1 Tax=Halospeciosus flavus TaxID=3032283 RepID=A0ABD5Z844_9EURY|nr:hypothetical protein [Halospeciosus flavus]
MTAEDLQGNDASNESDWVIVDTEKPEVWNGSSYDATNGNGIVNNSDKVTVTANVTDEFLRNVWVNASAFGAGNVSLDYNESTPEPDPVPGTETLYRGTFVVDEQNASADGEYPLYVWADDAGPNYNRTFAGNLTLDTTKPTFSNQTPAAGAFVNDSTRNVTVDIDEANDLTGRVVVANATSEIVNGTFANADGVTLTDDETLVVNTSAVAAGGNFSDGPISVDVTASDPENHTNSTEWTFVVDTTKPTISNTSVEAVDGDGVVADGQNVTVFATVTDAHLLNGSVTANVTPLGPESLQLERVDGTDNFSATFTVNATGENEQVDAKQFTFDVSAEDKANNTNTTEVGSITLDTLAPRVTDTGPDVLFTNDDQTNLSATLNETHLGSVHVLVENQTTTLVNQTVSPTNRTSQNVTLSGNASTGWHVEVEPETLADGNVTGTFTATDVDGNVRTANVSFVVDTQLPAFENVTITDVNNQNGYVADGNLVNVTFTLDEQYPDSVWANATPFGAGPKNLSGQTEPYAWTFRTTLQSGDDGSAYDVLLNATDRAGNFEETSTSNLTVDLTAPQFSDAAPAGGTVVGTATPTFTVNVTNQRNDLDYTNVSATFTDANSTHTVRVEGTNDGVTFDTWSNTTTNGTLTVNVSATNFMLDDGDVTVSVDASDVDGNANTGTFRFAVDTTPPTVSNVTVVDADGDRVVNAGDTVTVTANASDASSFQVYANASAFGVGTVNLTDANGDGQYEGTFTVESSGLAADGEHNVTVVAVDTVSNSVRTNRTLTVDTTDPTVRNATLTDVTNDNGIVGNGSEVRVAADVADANNVTVTADPTVFGAGTVTLTDSDGDGRYTAVFAVDAAHAGPDGNHSLTVEAVDTTGNLNTSATGNLTLDTDEPTFADPVPTTLVGTNQPTLSVNVSNLDNALDVANVSIRVDDAQTGVALDDTVAGTGDGVTFSNGTLTANLSAAGVTLVDGNVTSTVEAADVDGNTNTTTWSFDVDATAPTISDPTLIDATDGDGVVNAGDNVTITATVTDAHGVTVTANASELDAGQNVTLTRVSGTDVYNTTVTVGPNVTNGTATVTVEAEDVVGNVANATTGALAVDTVAPTVSDVRLVDATDGNGYVTDGDQVTVNATVTDAHDVTVTADATPFGASENVTLTRTTGDYYEATFAVNVSTNITEVQRITVSATDVAGNSVDNTSTSLVLDTVAPAAATQVTASTINLSNVGGYPVTVDLPDYGQPVNVSVRLSNEGSNVTATKRMNESANNVTLTLDASTVPDGEVEIATKVVDPADNINPGGWTQVKKVTKDTNRPNATSAHTAVGSREVYLAVSEPVVTGVNYTAAHIEESLSQSVQSVTLRGNDLLIVTFDQEIEQSQIRNSTVTIGLDEDVTDPAGNSAPRDGSAVVLREGATGIHSIDAEVRSTTMTVSFNGPVFSGDGGGLTAANFTYTDANGVGADRIVNVSHEPGSTNATLTLNQSIAVSDLGNDTIHIGENDVFNSANQSVGAQTVTVEDTRAPTVTDYSVSTKNRTISVTFASDEPLDDVRVGIESVFGGEGDTVLDESALTVTATPDGQYRYRATYTAPADGRYVVELTTARDYGENGATLPPAQTTAVDMDAPSLVLANISDAGVRDGSTYTNVTVTLSEPTSFNNFTADDVTFDGVNVTVTNVTHNTLGGNASVGDTVTITVAGELDTENAPTVVLRDLVEATGDGSSLKRNETTVYALVRDLQVGNNFVSFPVESGSIPLSSLDLTGVDVVWTYDDGTWKSYDPDAPTNTLTTIRGGQGYIFQMDTKRTMRFTLDNAAPASEQDSVTLEPGWNLVGHWQEGGQPTAQSLSSVENITSIRTHTGGLSYTDVDRFSPGDAYWVYVNGTTSQTYTVAPYTNTTATGGA